MQNKVIIAGEVGAMKMGLKMKTREGTALSSRFKSYHNRQFLPT